MADGTPDGEGDSRRRIGISGVASARTEKSGGSVGSSVASSAWAQALPAISTPARHPHAERPNQIGHLRVPAIRIPQIRPSARAALLAWLPGNLVAPHVGGTAW
jgi:hypothetical protein